VAGNATLIPFGDPLDVKISSNGSLVAGCQSASPWTNFNIFQYIVPLPLISPWDLPKADWERWRSVRLPSARSGLTLA